MDTRTFGDDDQDFNAVLDFVNRLSAPDHAMTAAGLRSFLSVPGFNARTDLFIAVDSKGGGILGARDVRVTARGDEETPVVESWGSVAAGEHSGDAAAALLFAAEARARNLLVERGRSAGIMQVRCDEDDVSGARSFESSGFRRARPLVSMSRPHVDDIAEPVVPAGIVLRSYHIGSDDAAWSNAFNDAFSDHWGGFMGMRLPLWRHYVSDPCFLPAISLVAVDGGEIAGFCHGRIDPELNALNRRSVGMIRYVGVRPRWRGQGLGAALTRAGMIALRDAGMTSVALGVDAENVTGAHRIYERLGFAVVGRQSMFRKEIAPT